MLVRVYVECSHDKACRAVESVGQSVATARSLSSDRYTPNAAKHYIFTLEKPDIYTLSLHALSAPVKNVLSFSQIEMS